MDEVVQRIRNHPVVAGIVTAMVILATVSGAWAAFSSDPIGRVLWEWIVGEAPLAMDAVNWVEATIILAAFAILGDIAYHARRQPQNRTAAIALDNARNRTVVARPWISASQGYLCVTSHRDDITMAARVVAFGEGGAAALQEWAPSWRLSWKDEMSTQRRFYYDDADCLRIVALENRSIAHEHVWMGEQEVTGYTLDFGPLGNRPSVWRSWDGGSLRDEYCLVVRLSVAPGESQSFLVKLIVEDGPADIEGGHPFLRLDMTVEDLSESYSPVTPSGPHTEAGDG